MDSEEDHPMEEIVVYNTPEEYSVIDALMLREENNTESEEIKTTPQAVTPKRRSGGSLNAEKDSVSSRLRPARSKTSSTNGTPRNNRSQETSSSPAGRSRSPRRREREQSPVLFKQDNEAAVFDEEQDVPRDDAEQQDNFDGRSATGTPPPSVTSFNEDNNDSLLTESPANPAKKMHWSHRRKLERLERERKRAETRALRKEQKRHAEEQVGEEEDQGEAASEGDVGSHRSERTKTTKRDRFSPTPASRVIGSSPKKTPGGEEEEEAVVEEPAQVQKKRRGRPPKSKVSEKSTDLESERSEAPVVEQVSDVVAKTPKKRKGREVEAVPTPATTRPSRRTKSLASGDNVSSGALWFRTKSLASGDNVSSGDEPAAKRTRLSAEGPSTSSQSADPAPSDPPPKMKRSIAKTQPTARSALRSSSNPSPKPGASVRKSLADTAARRPATRSTDQPDVPPPLVSQATPEEGVVKAPRYDPPARISKEEAKKEIGDVYDSIPPQFMRMFHFHVKGFAKSLIEENPELSNPRDRAI